MTHYYIDADTGNWVVPITFYKLPNGNQLEDICPIDGPETGKKADLIIQSGFTFEAEILTTGDFHATITSGFMDHAHVIVSCLVPDRTEATKTEVSKMINDFDINRAKEELDQYAIHPEMG